MIAKLKTYLSKEVSGSGSQNDSSDLFIFLRLFLLSITSYYLAQFLILAIGSSTVSAISTMICAVIFSAIFVGSYVFQQDTTLILTIVCTILSGMVLSLQWGFAMHFHYLMILCIPIVYSSIRWNTTVKIILSALIAVLLIVINLITLNVPPFCSINSIAVFISQQVSSVIFAIGISIASFYFCMKFTQAEHKVYIYNRQLKKMASLDPLTNLMNRRGMSDVLPDLQQEYESGTSGLSIAIGDIDFFKHVNDQYGHDCGDYILKSISDIFSKYMEGKGEICRWGGEEFLFAFTERNPDNVFVFLNDLRHTVKHTRFNFNGTDLRVTMTFGLEEYSPNTDISAVIKAADEKLYLGKESGRDKVVY